MKGQWVGKYLGSSPLGESPGEIIVNIEEKEDHFEAIVFLRNEDIRLPSVGAIVRTKDKHNDFKTKTNLIFAIDPRNGLRDSWDNLKQHFPDVVFPSEAEVEGRWNDESLILKWKTNIETGGKATLPKSRADQPSEYVPLNHIKTWSDYKKYVGTLQNRKFLFRGQKEIKRLRTKFHRHGRLHLDMFLNEDIQALHKHLSLRTRHLFDLSVPDENGAFFNLVQHHGYPTPLLDWSYSPYIAAFFAYRGISSSDALKASEEEKVRILILDQKQWRLDFAQPLILSNNFPYFSILETIAIENERMIPQQAASTVTNIDDIESYIKSKEVDGKQYLKVIELPVKERKEVMNELCYMGITAGLLFPGLDGACEELKERYF